MTIDDDGGGGGLCGPHEWTVSLWAFLTEDIAQCRDYVTIIWPPFYRRAQSAKLNYDYWIMELIDMNYKLDYLALADP